MSVIKIIMTATITIGLDADNKELLFYISFLQAIIDKNIKQEEAWKNRTREKKKKKTVDEVVEEIELDIQIERHNIEDANIEIENLELKRSELEKLEASKKDKFDDKTLTDIVKAVKKVKIARKKGAVLPVASGASLI